MWSIVYKTPDVIVEQIARVTQDLQASWWHLQKE
jgi:hypothetical protein